MTRSCCGQVRVPAIGNEEKIVEHKNTSTENCRTKHQEVMAREVKSELNYLVPIEMSALKKEAWTIYYQFRSV